MCFAVFALFKVLVLVSNACILVCVCVFYVIYVFRFLLFQNYFIKQIIYLELWTPTKPKQ